ncbi:hypothetical protein GUJ93_ZPchr0007g5377 [Zizania palustris]|uniref:Uncharacterized protein n=1 Tax=Zizania palustris TaxID=103762 RepID=A0A8J5TF18_ZIZPA|nr:hypothetical protein GUJ93_ZPchr0007g5377 [Zizania palustris]
MPIMEKATKWDSVNKKSNLVALEAELEKARAQMSELLDEKRAARKKLERFLTRLAEEKAAWKSRLKEELRMERHHRRQLEAANAKLLKEAASARQRYETERKARELMEEACEELTKEVEEDQAEVEALRRECVAMREEMEEERRMLQMAEVWREERVQMKLSDARAVLEHKYAHLNRLHAEMESFLRRTRNHHKLHFPLHKDKDKSTGTADAADALALRTIMADAATSVRGAIADYRSPHAPEDVDAVFEHFRRKNATNGGGGSPSLAHAAAASCSSSSPATELFLEKLHAGDDAASVSDGAGGWDWERERETPPKDSSAWVQGRSCDVPDANGSGVAESRSRRSGNFNTELIRRLWRSAISESRKKAAAAPSSTAGTCRVLHKGCSPLSYSDRDTTTTRPTVIEAAAAAKTATNKKKSLKEKLMEARMEDHRDHNKPCQAEAAVKQRS